MVVIQLRASLSVALFNLLNSLCTRQYKYYNELIKKNNIIKFLELSNKSESFKPNILNNYVFNYTKHSYTEYDVKNILALRRSFALPINKIPTDILIIN